MEKTNENLIKKIIKTSAKPNSCELIGDLLGYPFSFDVCNEGNK